MLAALQDDGRLTNQQLADLVGLSASQCSRRRMRLEEEKVIAGYHADLAGEALGFNLIAFIHITLATHSPDNAKKFRALVNRVDDIQEAYSLTGDADYVLKAVLRDLKGLSDLVNNVLMPHQSVAHVRSSIVLDRLKESARLPLKECAVRHGRNRGKFVIRVAASICDDPAQSTARHHGAATSAELRILRQGPAAERDGRADLFLRMHVLRGLRGEQAAQCLPELRRRLCAAADPARDGAAAGRVRHQAAAVGQARASEIQPRGRRRALRRGSGYSAAGAVKLSTSLRGAVATKQSIYPLADDRMLGIACASLAMTDWRRQRAYSAAKIVPSTSPKPTR